MSFQFWNFLNKNEVSYFTDVINLNYQPSLSNLRFHNLFISLLGYLEICESTHVPL